MLASLFDLSVWVASVFPTHPFHPQAQAVLQSATPDSPAVFCRVTELGLLRLLTTPAVLQHYGAGRVTNRTALGLLQSLLARPEIAEFDEPAGTAALWHMLATCDTASPKVWMDAYLAAFAIAGGLRFVTLDTGFNPYKAHGLQLVLLAS